MEKSILRLVLLFPVLFFCCAAECAYPERCVPHPEVVWDSSGMEDSGGCNFAAYPVVGSPKVFSQLCADSDTSTISLWTQLPVDDFRPSFQFEWSVVQALADTGAVASDIALQCRKAGEAIGTGGFGPEHAMDLPALTGSGVLDFITSAWFTPDCEPGDFLWVRWQVDEAGTTAMLSLAGDGAHWLTLTLRMR